MLRSAGPPTFSEPRISIEGTPQLFRMLAELLRAMADSVESAPEIRACGWRLVLGPDEAPVLRMESGCLLTLDCEPEAPETHSPGKTQP